MTKLSFFGSMNKKIITGSLALGVVCSFVFASTTNAFWPFDALFKKNGDVKAETTEKKMFVGDVRPEGSKAYMTYQTLVTMNDSCRRMFSQTYPTPTRPKVTPSSRERVADQKAAQQSTESINKLYEMEFGIESRNEKELTSIYNNLKARCDNIANLVSRMQKIYKGNVRPMVSITPTPSTTRPVTVAPTRRPLFEIKMNNEKDRNYRDGDGGSSNGVIPGGG